MIAQQGRIVAIDGDEAVVRIGGTSGCPACDAGKGCGAGVFGRLLRKRPVTVQVPNDIGARVGESVRLGIPEERFLALVFRLYVLPLIAALLGAALGFAVAAGQGLGSFAADMSALLFALGSAGLAMLWSRRRLKEFPLQSAVHLVHAAEPQSQTACAGPGRGQTDRSIPEDDEFE